MSKEKEFNIPFLTPLMVYQFEKKITKRTLITLTNMLAIHYTLIKEPKDTIDIYAENCIKRLHAFLDTAIITDETFGAALTLFIAALSETVTTGNKSLINNIQDQEIDTLIIMHFDIKNEDEKQDIKFILKKILNHKQSNNFTHLDILEHMHTKPKLIQPFLLTAASRARDIKKQDDLGPIIQKLYDKINKINIIKKNILSHQAPVQINHKTSPVVINNVLNSSEKLINTTALKQSQLPKVNWQHLLTKQNNNIEKFKDLHSIKTHIKQNITDNASQSHTLDKSVTNNKSQMRNK